MEIAYIAIAAMLAGALLCWLALGLPASRRAGRERAAREALAVEKAALEARLEAERAGHEARLADFEQKFAGLAASALDRNNEAFLELAGQQFARHNAAAGTDLEARKKEIETLVAPLNRSLADFDRKVGEIEKAREGAYRAIAEQVRSLAEGQTGLRAETGRLVQALRRPQTRGRWGEFQLRNVLEMAGMAEHVDFEEQAPVGAGEGRLRPDAILRLPGGKSIVVDAKTPLDAYLSAVEAADDGERAALMADHARQVRDHVRALASKAYWSALGDSPDFVVMFIPGEAFFAAAIEADPDLFEKAARDRVLLATPTTLIALAKAIAYGWRQEKLAENARAVADRGRDLHERVRVFAGHMQDLGGALGRAVDRYNKGVGSLEARVLPAARGFETLGAAPDRATIPALEPVELAPRPLRAAPPPETEAAE